MIDGAHQIRLPDGNELLTLILFLLFSVTSLIHYLLTGHGKPDARSSDKAIGRGVGLRSVLWHRAVMFAGAGLAPALIATVGFGRRLTDYGLGFYWSRRTVVAALIFALLSCVVSIGRKSQDALARNSQPRLSRWSPATILAETLSWAAYLLAYELMLRGFLLFSLLPYGVWTSIAVNTSLYVAVHIPKGAQQAFGAIIYGPVLCLLTLWSGTIWIAYFGHLSMALSYSFSCLAHNPEMRLVYRKDTALR